MTVANDGSLHDPDWVKAAANEIVVVGEGIPTQPRKRVTVLKLRDTLGPLFPEQHGLGLVMW
jgi:hypothetical protein